MALIAVMGWGQPGCGHCGAWLIGAFDEDHFSSPSISRSLTSTISRAVVCTCRPTKAGLDRQLAMAAVDQHQQLYAPRPAVVKERVQRRAYGSAGVENIVDQNDVAAGDIEADGAGNDDGANIAGGKVVAVEVDIENAGIDRRFLDTADQVTQPLRQGHPATLDADQPQVLTAIVFLDDLVRQPNQRALDFRCRHDAGLFPQHRYRTDLCFAHKCSGRMIRGLEQFCHYGGVIRCPGFPFRGASRRTPRAPPIAEKRIMPSEVVAAFISV
jgi:hypothetical protein